MERKMKKMESEFSRAFREIIQESEVIKENQEPPKNIFEEAKSIGISAAQLSRIKNGKSSLTNKVINLIAEKYGNDEQSRQRIKEKLAGARVRDSAKISVSNENSVEEFHQKFFQTDPELTRLICFSYREMPESINKGKHPEYIEKGSVEVKNAENFSCALFQFFGPKERIKDKILEAYEAEDKDARKAWEYIYEIADAIHEVFGRVKAQMGNIPGRVVLYESLEVPLLKDCSLHSRLMYSEELVGKDSKNIRIVQLLTGNDTRQHFVECTTESGFQIAVAAQFYPILDCWRASEGRLPKTENEVKEVLGKNIKCRWNIYT
jgi:transcriptional regulator with XRE-family HTH domain